MQQNLANQVGLIFLKIQKYEASEFFCGSRLRDIAHALDV